MAAIARAADLAPVVGVGDPHLVAAVDVDVLHVRVVEEFLQLPGLVHGRINGQDQPHVIPGVGGQFPAGRQNPAQMTLHRGGDHAHRQLVLIRVRQLRKPADLPVLLGPGHLIGHLLPQQADQLVIDADLTHDPMPSIVDASWLLDRRPRQARPLAPGPMQVGGDQRRPRRQHRLGDRPGRADQVATGEPPGHHPRPQALRTGRVVGQEPHHRNRRPDRGQHLTGLLHD